jgi:glycosyltransferase involved in cell wall biosynthesis
MKIGLVTPGGFDRSGRERVIPFLLWLVERLARRHEVHVYTLDQYPHPDTFSLLGATAHNIGYNPRVRYASLQTLHALRALRTEHRRGRFEVLHGLWAGRSGLIAALAGRQGRIPCVVSVVGGELVALPEIGYGGQLTSVARWRIELSLRLADAVTSASEFIHRLLRERRPDARLIPFGADCVRFTPPAAPPPGPPWRLLHIASLNRVKDQPTLLRAFREIVTAEPNVYLDIVGTDTLHGEVQRLAGDLGLNAFVTFHDFQPSDVVAEMLQRSHLLLHSSCHEAGPLVYLEAAACAVPTVGTAVGHIDDLAPEAAVAVRVGDYRAMAQAALALLHDDACRKALGQRALEFARSHDADWTADQFEALYAEIADPPRQLSRFRQEKTI